MNTTILEQFANATSLDTASLLELTQKTLKEATSTTHNELQELLLEKERLEHKISRKSDELQHLKYTFFDTIESLHPDNKEFLEKLHNIKVQSVELLDILEEMIESAILTTLEKGDDIQETLHEIIKEITFQTLNAHILNAVRIRQIFTSILQSSLNVAIASPNQADLILRGTLLGIRSALSRSIEKFRQYLLYVPEEVKALYRNEYLTIETQLEHLDTLSLDILSDLRKTNPPAIVNQLTRVTLEIPLDEDDLSLLSKETASLLKSKLATFHQELLQRSEKLLASPKAQEAKAMGIRAWSVAKASMQGAINSAKEAIDKNTK
jgi:uncharacterized protein YutE (UPF0331/DUF86 family)